jgi:DNA mismatch repair protein MutH
MCARYTTKEDVMIKALEAKDLPFGIMDRYDRLSAAKGSIGQVVEESHFEYKPNSDSEPDFKEAGVELKVTPYRRLRNTDVSAKERLVLNIINYKTEHITTFHTSSFWHKNQCLQMMFYEYKDGIPKADLSISHTIQFSYPEEDLAIIQDDWDKILYKIRAGNAHELSESDTLYLGACTKGADSNSLRCQPFSPIMARQRAYSLKQSYMTQILRNYVFGIKQDEKIIKDLSVLHKSSFEDYIISKLRPYFEKTVKELVEEFNIESTSKSLNEMIMRRILGVKGKLSQTDEFKKANIVLKTIRVQNTGKSIKENMSFPAFKFKELVNEEWETSTLKTMFDETKFLFIVLQFNDNDELVFRDVFFWNISNIDLDEVHKVWEKTVMILSDGVEIKEVKGRNLNNLPKASENRVSHVRPHAQDSSDTDELPDGRFMPKQCFWLNNSYIMSQVMKKSKLYK